MAEHRVTLADRRARLMTRHHLAPSSAAATPIEAASDLVGLHATDPATVYLSAWARVRAFRTEQLETALYEDRSLLRILGMRRTMFVVPRDVAAVIQAACAESIARGQRTRLVKMIEGAGIAADGLRWLEEVEARTLAALHARGEATAADLGKDVAGLREQMAVGEGRTWSGTVGVSTRLLFLLATEGRIIRGRPKGTLVSSLYRWAPMDTWVPGGLPSLPRDEAQAELVRRWLRSFGPGTRRDIQWWTGWTVAEVVKALRAIGAIDVVLDDGGVGYLLADDLDPVNLPDLGAVAFLPSLDATTMGWNERDWYLGSHRGRLFDTNGNAGPTIWLDGRVVGGWAKRRSGEIAWELLEDVGAEVSRSVAAKAAELELWLGDLRFICRFRTPVERALIEA